jgi:hypothetical protein
MVPWNKFFHALCIHLELTADDINREKQLSDYLGPRFLLPVLLSGVPTFFFFFEYISPRLLYLFLLSFLFFFNYNRAEMNCRRLYS